MRMVSKKEIHGVSSLGAGVFVYVKVYNFTKFQGLFLVILRMDIIPLEV